MTVHRGSDAVCEKADSLSKNCFLLRLSAVYNNSNQALKRRRRMAARSLVSEAEATAAAALPRVATVLALPDFAAALVDFAAVLFGAVFFTAFFTFVFPAMSGFSF
jgi:hypothetical protein